MRNFLDFLFGRKKTPPASVAAPPPVSASEGVASKPKPPVTKKTDEDLFLKRAARYEKRIEETWANLPPLREDHGAEIGFLITPWLGTAVPMFCLELMLLARSKGHRVHIILDNTEVAQNAENPEHQAAIRHMVTRLSSLLPSTEVGEGPASQKDHDSELAEKIVYNIAIWRERGESNAADFVARNPDAVAKATRHLARVRNVLGEMKLRSLFMPGGIFGLSAIYRHLAIELSIPFFTFDAGARNVVLSRNAVAAHRTDLARILEQIVKTASSREKEAICNSARAELDLRMEGKDTFGYQVTATDHSRQDAYDILLPLNIRWDSAALECELLFSSCFEWLKEMLGWLERNERWTMCIREHPGGRKPNAAGRENHDILMENYAHLGRRLRYVTASEQANTYDLMRHAKVVLPYTSSVGVEAAMLGKPVILHANCYYRTAGFCEAPSTVEEYFHALERALGGTSLAAPDSEERAAILYYLAQRCSFPSGSFNPNPAQFDLWADESPEQILASSPGREIVRAITEDGDVPLYLHREHMAAI